MSDRSSLHLFLYAVPTAEFTAALDCIRRAGLATDADLPDDQITLGVEYTDVEASVGSSAELLRDLLHHAPGSTFELWQLPVSGHHGDYAAHVPHLGHFQGPCDVDGTPTLLLAELLDAMVRAPRTGTSQAWLAREFGSLLDLFMALVLAKASAGERVSPTPVEHSGLPMGPTRYPRCSPLPKELEAHTSDHRASVSVATNPPRE
ncbi:hypothetical protein [Streptomyces sp. NPDC002952]|uniref:hypothetical protein n=1 Tax=Streptomyces sp. NPDC002952 TaxID=3364673 RepID=UPI0036CE04ED